MYDLDRGNLSRLTFDPGEDESPLWTPDGEHIAFAADRDGSRLTLQRRADGSGDEEVVRAAAPRHHHLWAWSSDDRRLVFTVTGPMDIWVATLGDPPEASGLVETAVREEEPSISPDGHMTLDRDVALKVFPVLSRGEQAR